MFLKRFVVFWVINKQSVLSSATCQRNWSYLQFSIPLLHSPVLKDLNVFSLWSYKKIQWKKTWREKERAQEKQNALDSPVLSLRQLCERNLRDSLSIKKREIPRPNLNTLPFRYLQVCKTIQLREVLKCNLRECDVCVAGTWRAFSSDVVRCMKFFHL